MQRVRRPLLSPTGQLAVAVMSITASAVQDDTPGTNEATTGKAMSIALYTSA